MRLVKPAEQWRSSFVEMASECEAAGERRYALAVRDFDAYLWKVEAARRGVDLPAGHVPSAELWLEDGGRILGCVRIRTVLTPELEIEGGHIGYDVRPAQRRRGCGVKLLRLALIEARALGIARVCITCDDDNVGSIRVIERNGGALARTTANGAGTRVRQYWVE